jgi:dihydrofolate reductase
MIRRFAMPDVGEDAAPTSVRARARLPRMTRPPLSMILALATNGALGLGGTLPWSYPEDREHFERTTRGHAVIMGRRTWEEEGRPLPERINIVVSRSFVPPDGTVLAARSLDEALVLARKADPEPFVIGGADLFAEALPQVIRIYLTEIPESPQADVHFQLDRTGFVVTHERMGERGARFLVLDRI